MVSSLLHRLLATSESDCPVARQSLSRSTKRSGHPKSDYGPRATITSAIRTVWLARRAPWTGSSGGAGRMPGSSLPRVGLGGTGGCGELPGLVRHDLTIDPEDPRFRSYSVWVRDQLEGDGAEPDGRTRPSCHQLRLREVRSVGTREMGGKGGAAGRRSRFAAGEQEERRGLPGLRWRADPRPHLGVGAEGAQVVRPRPLWRRVVFRPLCESSSAATNAKSRCILTAKGR